jgi:hypothetical protein
MMEAARTSETSVDNHFTRQYIPEDSSEHHTRRRENLKSHDCALHGDKLYLYSFYFKFPRECNSVVLTSLSNI